MAGAALTSAAARDRDGTRIYTNLLRDGQLVAGMGGQQPGMQGAPPIWSTYVAVTDIDETSKEVEAAGGVVMMPAMDVMDVGRMAIYGDPTGSGSGHGRGPDRRPRPPG